MAKPVTVKKSDTKDSKVTEKTKTVQDSVTDDFAADLIKMINKEHNEKIAFNLGTDNAPTYVKRWISTGSKQMDYIISNKRDGGLPEGRIVEIQGPPGIGKSTLVSLIARSTQRMGGIAVYIDTENATNPDMLAQMGVDVAKRFIFVQSPCTEEILNVIESTILKARSMTKDVPVTVIWDSVSQSSPRAELEGDYDQNSIGLQARVLSKGMRKIANVIGGQNVLLVLVSQQRIKIGCVDPSTVVQYRKVSNPEQITAGTISKLFTDMGHDFSTMKLNEPIKVNGWEVKTINDIWKPITQIVRKSKAEHMQLTTDTGNYILNCSPEHKVFVQNHETKTSSFEEVEFLRNAPSMTHKVMTESGWLGFNIEKITNSFIEIADIEVGEEHSYYTNGILSHNTMFGDPVTTAGGMAIPYSASVRIRLDGGSQIKDKDENVIGINCTARTIKNKVAKPFRKIGFRILFGRGIFENDELFDLLRLHCKDNAKTGVKINGKCVSVDGEGSWKTFTISDEKTGDVETEVKFYKADFTEKVLDIPEYKDYVDALMDDAFILGLDGKVETHSTYGALVEGENGAQGSSVEDLPAN